MKKFITISILVLLTHLCFSQTLEKKWNNMVEKSNSYNSHKIIRSEELNGMWSSVQDSLMMMRVRVKNEQNKVNTQNSEIASLNAKIRASNEKFNAVSLERDKADNRASSNVTYILTLWIFLAIVSGICAVLYFLFNKSNSLTKQKTNDYEQLLKSFEDYKTSKLEVERKLKREIQTYMNTVEEMKTKRV
ncbi:MAG: hypothetical protein H7329_14270 [Opitutaceae bacterium]|nr:hypothetical protein [Cytophagales bacterium]